jgi:hypothetical protein
VGDTELHARPEFTSRRSRLDELCKTSTFKDVPEHHRSKIGESFRFSSLALLYTVFHATFEQGESVQKALIFQRGRPLFMQAHQNAALTYLEEGQSSAGRSETGGDSSSLPCPGSPTKEI